MEDLTKVKFLNYFEMELTNPAFSDESAEIEYYEFTKMCRKDIKEGIFALYEKHRPHVAIKIKEALERI
ncbi:hypothetical protein HYW53_03020 [Candidatus Giovannonibacteria bacterium]|nr:hypothetical protein [Candidatus Giovannonibacteria bacterium]